jgi:hypothetical protein
MENFQNFRYGLSLCLKIVHLLGVKLGIRLIFGVIIQFFVCGSEFRARWHIWMKDSCGALKFLSNRDKKSILPKMSDS